MRGRARTRFANADADTCQCQLALATNKGAGDRHARPDRGRQRDDISAVSTICQHGDWHTQGRVKNGEGKTDEKAHLSIAGTQL